MGIRVLSNTTGALISSVKLRASVAVSNFAETTVYVKPVVEVEYIVLALVAYLDVSNKYRLYMDVVNTTETITKVFSKANLDIATTIDSKQISLGKRITDTSAAIDTKAVALTKLLTDTVSKQDAASISFTRQSNDIVIPADVVNTKSVGKNITDSLYKANEGPNQKNTYALTYFLEDYCLEGGPSFAVNKVLTDTTTSADSRRATITAPKVDSVRSSDSGSIGTTDYWAIDYVAGDYVGTYRTF
jgi:hypothetical protein